MLGGFKWHSNAGGLEGGLLTQVSPGSHCAAGGTHRSHHTPSPLPPALMPYSSCLNSKAEPWSSALNSTWTPTYSLFWHPLKHKHRCRWGFYSIVYLFCPNFTGENIWINIVFFILISLEFSGYFKSFSLKWRCFNRYYFFNIKWSM